MSATAATLLLESYNHAALSQHKRILGILTNRAMSLKARLEVVIRLTRAGRPVRKLLDVLHNPILEHLPPEGRTELAVGLSALHTSNVSLLKFVEEYTTAVEQVLHVGYWRPIFKWAVSRLIKLDQELVSYVEAIQCLDDNVLILSRNDQESVARLLINPPEPNERLRSALKKHTLR